MDSAQRLARDWGKLVICTGPRSIFLRTGCGSLLHIGLDDLFQVYCAEGPPEIDKVVSRVAVRCPKCGAVTEVEGVPIKPWSLPLYPDWLLSHKEK
jgi:hypothetical protein